MRKKINEDIVKLNRHILGSIDLDDIVDADSLEGTDRKNYLEQAEVLFANPVLINEIKRAIKLQVEFIAREAVGEDQMYIGRGGINLGELLIERFTMLHSEYKEKVEPEEPFDPLEII